MNLREKIVALEELDAEIRHALQEHLEQIDRRLVESDRHPQLIRNAKVLTFTSYEVDDNYIRFYESPYHEGDDGKSFRVSTLYFFDPLNHKAKVTQLDEQERAERESHRAAGLKAAQTKKEKREAKELAEFARLKAKYEA